MMADNHAFLEALHEYEMREFGEQLYSTEDSFHDSSYCYWQDIEIAPGIVARLCAVCGFAQWLPEESRQAQLEAGQLELWIPGTEPDTSGGD